MSHSLWMAAGWTMLHLLWVGTVVGVVSWIALRLVRRARPQVRYLVALGGFASLAASPVVVFSAVTATDALPTSTKTTTEVTTTEALCPPGEEARAADGMLSGAGFGDDATDSETGLERMVRWLPWIWLAGAGVTFALLLAGVVGVERLTRASRILRDGPAVQVLRALSAKVGCGRRVLVATCERIASPVVVGILRPVILVPPGVLLGLSPEQLEMVILHELTHVRRWDNLVNLFQRVVESLLFFHPVTWALSRRIRREREHCCDAVVVQRTDRPHVYARTLLDLASPSRRPALAAALSGPDVVVRVREILNQESKTMTWTHRLCGAVGGATCLLALMITVVAQSTPSAPATKTDEPSTPAQQALDPFAQWVLRAAHPGIDPWHQEVPPGCTRDAKVVFAKVQNCMDCHKAAPHASAKVPHDGVHMKAADCINCHQVSQNRLPGFVHTQEGVGRRWGPEQATGKPDTPEAGDKPTAWASLTEDGQDEWIELTWKKAVPAISINIYNTFNPGAVSRVWAWDQRGRKRLVWEGKDVGPKGAASWVTVVPVREKMKTRRVCVEVASRRVPGWNEIDAVGLVDRAGKTHWAAAAKASSTFADFKSDQRMVLEATRALGMQSGRSKEAQLRKELDATRKKLDQALKRLAELERRLAGGDRGRGK